MSSVVAQGAAASRGSSLRTAAWAGLFVVVAVAPLLTPNAFHLHLAVLVCLNVIIVSGLALISRTGQLSFGHGAFVAIGAYAAVLLGTKAGWPFWVAAIAAVLCAALIALALGWVILRLRGVYFVLVTFAFAELVRLVLLEWPGVTGGANGISGIAPASLFGHAFDTKERFYVLALVVAASCIGMLYRISRTPAGHTFDAICENAALAEASGLNVHRLQVKAYVIGSGVAGLGGVLLAHYVGFVSPESFNTALSVAVIVMLVIGGRESVWGPLVGAVLLTPLPELFRGAVQTQHIFYGIALILILRLLPGGLVQLPAALSRLRKRASP